MSGWGLGSWGLSPWGSGAEPPRLVSANAIRENAIRLVFDQAVRLDDSGGPRDGARIDFYGVLPVVGTVGLDGEPARPVSVARVAPAGSGGAAVELGLDRPLTHWPSRYVVTAFGVWSLSGFPIDPEASSAVVEGVRAAKAPRPRADSAEIVGADIALPFTASAANASRGIGTLLGAYTVDATGDFAWDAGLTTLMKRVLRRLFTEPGTFSHLPSYGLGLRNKVKRLATATELRRLEREAESQVRREPEVESCSVRIAHRGAGIHDMSVKVKTRFGLEASTSVPIAA